MIYPKEFRSIKIPVERNTCFFLMPFKDELNIVYGSIKDHLEKLEINCSRIDEDYSDSSPIIEKIIRKIISSQYLIVDISYMNPNVFYELGIAHTFKDSRNILILKQKKEQAPFDISYIRYIEYNKDNLFLLLPKIQTFIESNKKISDFYNSLNINNLINIIDENNNACIENFQLYLKDEISTCINILDNNIVDIKDIQLEQLFNIINQYINKLTLENEFDNLNQILNIYFVLLLKTSDFSASNNNIKNLLYGNFNNCMLNEATMIEKKIDLAVKLAENEKALSLVMPWIIDYFQKSKSASIDLNRYKLENLLMKTKNKTINEYIISSLDNDNCYIREHMSDIIGEKKLEEAINLLCFQLEKEENFFTASSIISAIGKLGKIEGIDNINLWIYNNLTEIRDTRQFFVLRRALIAIKSLDNTEEKKYINEFNEKYYEDIKNYFII